MSSPGVTRNRRGGGRRLIRKLGRPEQTAGVLLTGPSGYVLYWQLSELGVECDVVAPRLMPVKAGDQVKTDRRDAEKLAPLLPGWDVTAVWVPDAARGDAGSDACALGSQT